MDYHKFIPEDNKPVIVADILPLFKKIYSSKIVHIVAIILATILVVFLSFHSLNKSGKSINKILLSRESTLNEEITKIQNRNDMLEAEILLLKNEKKALIEKNDKKKIEKISKYLGNSEVSGAGIEILLKDNDSDFAPAQEDSNFIHNTDLLKIVNFLWENGATAISINGERILQNTHITCVGATILINDKRVISPFTIKATGKNLDKDMGENSSIVLSLKLRGIELKIDENDNIILPAGKFSSSKE